MDTRCWLKIPTIRHHPAPFLCRFNPQKRKETKMEKNMKFISKRERIFMALAGIVIVVIIVAQVLHEIKAFE